LALLEIAELAACATASGESKAAGGGAVEAAAMRVPTVALVLSLGCGQPAAAASHAMTTGSSNPSQWFGGVAASIASAQGEV